MEILKKEVSEKVYYTVTALIVLSVIVFSYASTYLKSNPPEVIFNGVEPINFEVSKKQPVEEIVFTKSQTQEDKKDMLIDRLNTVSSQPLYPSERQAIFSEYGNLNKTNLSEEEKQQLIKALNSK